MVSVRSGRVVIGEHERHGASSDIEVEDHRQSATRCLLGGDGAAHCLGEAAGDGQAEADSVLVGDVAEPLEGREDAGLIALGDTRTGVGHDELDPPALDPGGDGSAAPVPDRVGRQVLDDPLEEAGIAEHVGRSSSTVSRSR